MSEADISFVRISTWNKDFVSAIRRHYTKSRGAPPGKKMAWEIWEGEILLGYIGLGEPSFKLSPRRILGLEDARPLPMTVNNFIFRLETKTEIRASKILRLFHDMAAKEWEHEYGWKPIHWETLIDPKEIQSNVVGSCYRRAVIDT
jgi:hypothetical protein